jgi:hypothetical protein
LEELPSDDGRGVARHAEDRDLELLELLGAEVEDFGEPGEPPTPRLVGFELEMSDIKTADAAAIVYDDPTQWQDRHGKDYIKPALTYDRFHVVSDPTLRNSDGTLCMRSYRDSDGRLQWADRSEGHPDHLMWKGAELISPPFDYCSRDGRQRLFSRCEDDYFPRLQTAGAVCSAELHDGLHVHVDISALDWTTVRDLLVSLRDVQWELHRLGTRWWGHQSFSDQTLEALQSAETREEFDAQYHTLRDDENRVYRLPRGHDYIRRVVDIGPYLDPDRPDTVEFRCFRAAMDRDYISMCISLALRVVDEYDHAGFLTDLTMRVYQLLWAFREDVYSDRDAGDANFGGPPLALDEAWRIG